MGSQWCIGIDPGASGGVSLAYKNEQGQGILFWKLPETEHDINKLFSQLPKVKALIELVHAFPGQGATSMFTFGRGYGFLRGCLVAHGIPFEEVTPQAWQKLYSLKRKRTDSKTEYKNKIKAKAQNIYPSYASEITLAVCDAILIARFGLETGLCTERDIKEMI